MLIWANHNLNMYVYIPRGETINKGWREIRLRHGLRRATSYYR